MSESGYQTLDLDNIDKKPGEPEFEIVDGGMAEGGEVEIHDEPVVKKRQVAEEDEGEEAPGEETNEEDTEGSGTGRKKRTRADRLRAQRDNLARELEQVKRERDEAKQRASRSDSIASDATAIGLDSYINAIDNELKTLRAQFNEAYDAGDRDKLADIQLAMAEKAAEKKQAQAERKRLPTKAAGSNEDQSRQTQRTDDTSNRTTGGSEGSVKVNPEATKWARRNVKWFNKNPAMTAAAHVFDRQLVQEGWDPTDPEYFEELDRLVREEFPHRFKDEEGEEEKPQRRAANKPPTIANRQGATDGVQRGKIRVTITADDRRMADHLNVPIEQYAREKWKREQSRQNSNEYTTIGE